MEILAAHAGYSSSVKEEQENPHYARYQKKKRDLLHTALARSHSPNDIPDMTALVCSASWHCFSFPAVVALSVQKWGHQDSSQ